MKILITVDPHRLKVSPKIPKYLLENLCLYTRYRVDNYEYTVRGQEGWNGYVNTFNVYKQEAPAGLWRRIQNFFKNEEFDVEVVWAECKPLGKKKPWVHTLDLAHHQIRSVEAAVKGRYGIIDGAIRSGKTAIMGAILNKINRTPAIVLTVGKDLVIQTSRELERFTDFEVGSLVDSKYEKGEVLVTSYHALISALKNRSETTEKTKQRNKEIRKFVGDTDVLLLDECHYALAPKTAKALKKLSPAYKIGLSGTPNREGTQTTEREAALGPTLCRVSLQQMVEIGRLAKPLTIWYELPAQWYLKDGIYDFGEDYDSNIIKNAYRNQFIKEIVDNLYSKGKSSFVMVSKIEHGKELERLIPKSYFVRGAVSTKVRWNMYRAVQEGKLSCVISTVSKLGLDLPKLNAVINAEGYRSKTSTVQKLRSLTGIEGKRVGLIIDFLDHSKYTQRHSIQRLKLYKSKQFVIKKRQVPEDYYGK